MEKSNFCKAYGKYSEDAGPEKDEYLWLSLRLGLKK